MNSEFPNKNVEIISYIGAMPDNGKKTLYFVGVLNSWTGRITKSMTFGSQLQCTSEFSKMKSILTSPMVSFITSSIRLVVGKCYLVPETTKCIHAM